MSLKNYAEVDDLADVDYSYIARYIRCVCMSRYLLMHPISYLGRAGY
jgi:hypothetical protein